MSMFIYRKPKGTVGLWESCTLSLHYHYYYTLRTERLCKHSNMFTSLSWVLSRLTQLDIIWPPLMQAKVAELALERETEKLNQARAQLQSCEQQLSAAQQHVTKRVVQAKWQWAGTAANLTHMQDPFSPPPPLSLKASSKTELVKQVCSTSESCETSTNYRPARAERGRQRGCVGMMSCAWSCA